MVDICFLVISRAPGLKLVVQTLLSSLRPIGHIVVICCTFFIIFGILGVQVRYNYQQYSQDLLGKHKNNIQSIRLDLSFNLKV